MKKPYILTEPPRRRRFTSDQKASILSEVAGGLTVTEVARAYQVSQSLIYNWLREAKKSSTFVRLVPSASPAQDLSSPLNLPAARVCLPSGIVIEFASALSLDDIVVLAARLGGRP
ncbi:MAG: hypothetical protein EOP04_03350 [Proteobacteria bacterium]|nr:MAG: hypothetical protein EOP04_03350 [Pseudomonadota bacterium]